MANRKGGVGKTTSVVNLASILAREHGRKVLAWDLDSQGHLTLASGAGALERGTGSYRVIAEGRSIVDTAAPSGWGYDLLTGGADLSAAEALMATATSGNGRMVLREALDEVPSGTWDLVLLDTPPALKDLTMSALIASAGVLVPLPMEPLPMDGYRRLRQAIDGVRRYDNAQLRVLGVFETLTNARTAISAKVRRELEDELVSSGDRAALLESVVRINTRLAAVVDVGRPVVDVDPACNGAADYRALAAELVARGVV